MTWRGAYPADETRNATLSSIPVDSPQKLLQSVLRRSLAVVLLEYAVMATKQFEGLQRIVGLPGGVEGVSCGW
jgi:hypothetical protein